MYVAVVAAVCLLLISPPRTLQSEQNDLHPLAPPHVRQLHEVEESALLDVKQTCRCDPNRCCNHKCAVHTVPCAVTARVFGPHQMPPWIKETPKWVSSSLPPSGPLPSWLRCTASTPNSTPSSNTCTPSWMTTRVNVLISVILLMVCSPRSPRGLSDEHDCACRNTRILPAYTTACHRNKKPVNRTKEASIKKVTKWG